MKLILLQPQLRARDTEYCIEAFRKQIGTVASSFSREDIILLPEHAVFVEQRSEYLELLRNLVRDFRCHIVGGSYHEKRGDAHINTGVALDPDGNIISIYEKIRPYADERKRVIPGNALGEFTIAGKRILVLICADFWFSDLFYRTNELPDLVLVPALSVTRKPSPAYSRALWRNLAVTRAYEFGVYIGVSDWGYPSELRSRFTCGVGGFADPTGIDPDQFYTPIGEMGVRLYEPDFSKLDNFREDRQSRGFFWKNS